MSARLTRLHRRLTLKQDFKRIVGHPDPIESPVAVDVEHGGTRCFVDSHRQTGKIDRCLATEDSRGVLSTMSIFIRLLLTLALTAALCSCHGTGPRVRVLTYNIHHGEGTDGELDLDRIARVIRSVDPDLVALQEVDQGLARTGAVDQPAEIGKRTGLHVMFGANLEHDGGLYGNCVLSRWPVLMEKNHPLPRLDDGEPRGCLEVRVEMPDRAGTLTLLATHFDHRRAPETRLAAVAAIESLVAEATGPILLAGDLNASPDSEPLARLGASWVVAREVGADEPDATVPVEDPQRQIDYVLFRPAGKWHVVDVEVLDEPLASDHRPLLAVLEWRGEASPPSE